ncbi:sirohydrochlorin ferrochelatase-like protein [Trifolium pratense]|uniref:Sirohydrochlorin ferrochelatase-like protein n=1 Tax=Trifolium pratense TaxID=57577 RepID=A0A2K3K4T6_TRIPR|nr:sirohydrochlorin ferrochelatase-like protein [Trifolium pratense]
MSAEAAKQHPGVSYIITAPLGLHVLLVDIVNDRINDCLKQGAGDADECSVCDGTGKCN